MFFSELFGAVLPVFTSFMNMHNYLHVNMSRVANALKSHIESSCGKKITLGFLKGSKEISGVRRAEQ